MTYCWVCVVTLVYTGTGVCMCAYLFIEMLYSYVPKVKANSCCVYARSKVVLIMLKHN